MHSSTSSFERQVPHGPWLGVCALAICLVLAAAFALEWRLAGLGFVPTVEDSESRWQDARRRANTLGSAALVLVGASRIQLGVDLDVLRRGTGMEPVQLAIDGSSFVPVLKGLAEDRDFRGTVLVDYYDSALALPAAPDEAQRAELRFQATRGKWSGREWEDRLADRLHEQFRFFADGGRPLDAFMQRAANSAPEHQYLMTLKDRSKTADYQQVRMPFFYHTRVIATLSAELRQRTGFTAESPHVADRLRAAIDAIKPSPDAVFHSQSELVRAYVNAITRRGGRIIFVAMPTSGMVREIIERRYPRPQFRDAFAARMGTPFIDADRAFASEFVCPDGSHLDVRDRGRFTTALAAALKNTLAR